MQDDLKEKRSKSFITFSQLMFILFFTFLSYQVAPDIFNHYNQKFQISNYKKALLAGDAEVRKVRLKMISKGYSQGKINRISVAARTQLRSEKEDQ